MTVKGQCQCQTDIALVARILHFQDDHHSVHNKHVSVRGLNFINTKFVHLAEPNDIVVQVQRNTVNRSDRYLLVTLLLPVSCLSANEFSVIFL